MKCEQQLYRPAMQDLRGIPKLLIATRNAGKTEEARKLLRSVQIDLRFLEDFPSIETPDETGSSYAENAVIKASAYARQTGMCALADDSGLEVDALGGRPGLFSARYAGGGALDSERVELLLSELSTRQDAERTARFRCSIAVVDPNGKVLNVSEGICEGIIAGEARGHNGFGYDPIFVPRGHTRTFGELSPGEKDRISHRANALRLTRTFLLKLVGQT